MLKLFQTQKLKTKFPFSVNSWGNHQLLCHQSQGHRMLAPSLSSTSGDPSLERSVCVHVWVCVPEASLDLNEPHPQALGGSQLLLVPRPCAHPSLTERPAPEGLEAVPGSCPQGAAQLAVYESSPAAQGDARDQSQRTGGLKSSFTF